MKRGGRGSHAPDSGGGASGITEAAVRKATGKGWGDWYALLDAAGAQEMTHQQIISAVARHQQNTWWQQMIAAAYEQARSLRERHQREDGFAANASKLIRAGVTRVYAAWVEDELRAGWLDASGWNIRKSTPCKSLRITWKDGHTHVDVALWPRSVGKTLLQVEHSRLATLDEVHRFKAFWGVALERLRGLLEAAEQTHSLAA
jgi:hypothetical protein